MNRMINKILHEISETQLGFMKDKVQKNLYLCCIDYSNAFDKVKHSDLFEILLRYNCDGKDHRVMRNLYWEQEATIRIDDDCGVFKPICRGMSGLHFFSRPFQYLRRRSQSRR